MKLKFLNNYIGKYGFQLRRVPKSGKRLLYNVFNKANPEKRVLISYLTQPFSDGIKFTHSIFTECYTAAKVFDDLGYQVDVTNYNDSDVVIDFGCYDVVYGLGHPLEHSFYADNTEKIIKILYGTGTSPFYFYKVSGQSVFRFYKKTNLLLPESARMNNDFWPMQFTCADAIIALGNSFCEQTYLDQNPLLRTFNLKAFFFDVNNADLEKKNFETAKKHFLWFGSNGLLYKGLGILIDIFSKRADITLHICGGNKLEVKFWQHYQPLMAASNNIIDHGFVDIKSIKFKEIMNICAFAIFPSVSEGGSPSTLNVIANGGLIPIISKASTIDIGDYGFVLDEITESEINFNISEALSLSNEELRQKSINAMLDIRNNYTLDNYKFNLKTILTNILSN